MQYQGEAVIVNRILKILNGVCAAAALLTVLLSCEPTVVTDYQAFMDAGLSKALIVLNGNAESISALDPVSGNVYDNIQIVGHSGTNSAVPVDIMTYGSSLFVMLSGQNSIESYDKTSLDYMDDGKHYFKNGYNPMAFIPVPGKSWVFTAGFENDEVQPVNLMLPSDNYDFIKSYETLTMPADAHSETKSEPSDKNAVGDNKKRGSTGGAVLSDGASSRLFVTNVRYDSSILMTEDGELVENVKAGGYFREATLSIFSFNADAMQDGASAADLSFSLVKEISLEELFYEAAGGEYFPGDGLNPQSAYILEGRLHVICTGTNGGSLSVYTDGEYIPPGFAKGDTKPGTDPDDGLIIILDISNPDYPSYLAHLDIGGSPVGFRTSVDTVRKTVYLAGVGGIESYVYGESVGSFAVKHSSADMILTSENPDTDYYSGLYYDDSDSALYISFYTGDSIKTIAVSGTADAGVYTEGNSYITGDGPGALCILEK
jgi:hypothetical protein